MDTPTEMWNVLLETGNTTEQINSVPYDLEQLIELLTQLAALDEPVGRLVIANATESVIMDG